AAVRPDGEACVVHEGKADTAVLARLEPIAGQKLLTRGCGKLRRTSFDVRGPGARLDPADLGECRPGKQRRQRSPEENACLEDHGRECVRNGCRNASAFSLSLVSIARASATCDSTAMEIPADIFTEPEKAVDTLANLGPLSRLAGVWEGTRGHDVNPKGDGPEHRDFQERI